LTPGDKNNVSENLPSLDTSVGCGDNRVAGQTSQQVFEERRAGGQLTNLNRFQKLKIFIIIA